MRCAGATGPAPDTAGKQEEEKDRQGSETVASTLIPTQTPIQVSTQTQQMQCVTITCMPASVMAK